MIQNLWDTAKAVLTRKFITIQAQIRKQEKSQINNLTFLHLKELEKEKQKNPNVSRRKVTIKIRAEMNEIETKRKKERERKRERKKRSMKLRAGCLKR